MRRASTRSTLRARADADAAFDLTAETFAQAWLVRRRFRDEANGSAAPWLFGIARHLVAQSVRSRRIESGACERLGIRDRLDEVPATVEPTVAGSRASTRRSPICRRASVPPSNCV